MSVPVTGKRAPGEKKTKESSMKKRRRNKKEIKMRRKTARKLAAGK
jgi:hypothetical protein